MPSPTPPRSHRAADRAGARLFAAGLGAALALASGSAAAEPGVARLVVHRAPAAADCPDAATLAASVEALTKRRALDPASTDRFSPLYEVQIFRADDGYAAILQSGGLTRQLSDPGSTCEELAEALALTLAILLDSEAPPRTAPSPVQVTPPAAPPPAAEPPPAEAPREVPPLPPPPPRPASLPQPRTWEISADVGAAQTIGFLTPFSWALVAEGSVRLASGSFGGGVIWVPSRTVDVPPGEVDLGLIAGTLRACGALFGRLRGPRLSLCAQPMLGVIQGAGRGYNPDRQGSAPWFALGAAALGEGPLVGPIGWSARATFVVPVASEQFTIERREGTPGAEVVRSVAAFDPSPVGFLVGAGLRVSIP